MKDYLQRFQPEEQRILNDLIRMLHLSYSNRLKLLTYVFEIMKREEVPVQDVLDAWKTHRVCLAAEQSLKEDSRRVAVDYTLPQ